MRTVFYSARRGERWWCSDVGRGGGFTDSRIRWRPGRVSSLLLVHGGAQLTERASRPDGTVQQPVTPSAGGCRDSGDADGGGRMSSTLERRKGWDWQSIGFRGGVGAGGCRSDFGGRPPVFFLLRGPLSATPRFPKSPKRIAPKRRETRQEKQVSQGAQRRRGRWKRESLPHSNG